VFTRIKQAARFLLLTAVILLFSQVTDADLLDREEVTANTVRATTLDFSNRDTANETGKSLFFSVDALADGRVLGTNIGPIDLTATASIIVSGDGLSTISLNKNKFLSVP